jgi:chromosome partitioning protein
MGTLNVISIWNPKGGQGKSMLAINVAAAAEKAGLRPLLVCMDQQGTAISYHDAGHLPFPVVAGLPEKKPDADIVLIDHMASDWTMPDAPIVLMPLKPARDQYRTYIDAQVKAERAGKRIITVVTDYSHHRASERAAVSALRKKGAIVIPSSGVFSRAADDYRTIFDSKLDSAYKVRERRFEMNKILDELMEVECV